eukprot:11119256-Lingulodinium_polyedra.AAC.1
MQFSTNCAIRFSFPTQAAGTFLMCSQYLHTARASRAALLSVARVLTVSSSSSPAALASRKPSAAR